MSRKKIIYFLALVSLLYIVIIGLNRYLDITQTPQKSDIIVCLGGGLTERLEKTVQLYKSGYSKSDKIILTGTLIGKRSDEDPHGFLKIPFLEKNGIERLNVIFIENTTNTYKEVLNIKKFMLKQGYKSVIIISDPPHSRRIKVLSEYSGFSENGLSVNIVGSDVSWWHKNYYINSIVSLKISVQELVKLLYFYYNYK